MLELLTDPQVWASLVTLSAMEIVLGIDNVVFISVIVTRLPDEHRERVRQIGLGLALLFRILLLFTITWLIGLTRPVFEILDQEISWRDIILIAGGLFLIAKATHEIHRELEEPGEPRKTGLTGSSMASIIVQIAIIDMVFSIDSIITAVGMAQHIEVMVAAVMIAIAIMYFASGPVSAFIAKHPTTKMLALSFLLLIGVALIADGIEFHIPRGYIYVSMGFAAAVETINVLAKRRRERRARMAR